LKEENRKKIVENFSLKKYNTMLDLLDHPEKIAATQDAILPDFIKNAIQQKHQIKSL
jgi:hypothetical protein